MFDRLRVSLEPDDDVGFCPPRSPDFDRRRKPSDDRRGGWLCDSGMDSSGSLSAGGDRPGVVGRLKGEPAMMDDM